MDLAEFMLRIFSSKDIAAVERLFARRSTRLDRAQVVVRPILEEVKKKGIGRWSNMPSNLMDWRRAPFGFLLHV